MWNVSPSFLPNLGLRLTLSGLDPGIFRGAQRAFFLEQPSSGNAGISGDFPRGYGGRKTTGKQQSGYTQNYEI
jgi:hypothetical protein